MHKFSMHSFFALTFALLLPGTLLATTSDPTDSRKEAIQLTQNIESTGRAIQKEADQLAALRRNHRTSNQSHQYSLNRIASHINEQLQPAMSRLVEIQQDLPQWHQHAIKQMHTSAATLASSANAAILNRNPSDSWMAAAMDDEYGQLLENINGRAMALVQIADATGDYGDAQLKGHRAGLAIAGHE